MRYVRVIASLLAALLLHSGCLTDSGNHHELQEPQKKNMLLTLGRTRLIHNEQEHFQITSSPEPEDSECLVWHFTGPDTVICIVQPAQTQNDIEQISFYAGDWVLRVAIYDSAEFEMLGEKASDHGTTERQITVREITVDLISQSGGTLQDFLFHGISPEKDWLHENTDYIWDFGDGTTTVTTDFESTAHQYDFKGTYQVIVSIASTLYEDDDTKYIIAADTLQVNAEMSIAGLLDLQLFQHDTLSDSTNTIIFFIIPSITKDDYSTEVLWEINFGDGYTSEFNDHLNMQYFQHSYQYTGVYTIHVSIRESGAGRLLAEDTLPITITYMPYIKQTNKITVNIRGYVTEHRGTIDADSIWTENSKEDVYKRNTIESSNFAWSDQDFSSEYTNDTDTETTIVYMNGTISHDGGILVRLEYTKNLIYSDDLGNNSIHYERFIFENIPLETSNQLFYYYIDTSSEIGQYITNFENWNRTDYADGTTGYDFYDEFDWLNTSLGIPYLSIKFTRE